MVGYTKRFVIEDTLTLSSGASKTYDIECGNVLIYGYSHNLGGSIYVYITETAGGELILSCDSVHCTTPVTLVKTETGITVKVTAKTNLSGAEFKMVIYYCEA